MTYFAFFGQSNSLFRRQEGGPFDGETEAEAAVAKPVFVHGGVQAGSGVEAAGRAHGQVSHRRRPDQSLVRLMDGRHSLCDTAEVCCDVRAEHVVDILDIVHVAGCVWRAAKTFHPHREHQEAFARERLRRMATLHDLRDQSRREIETACGCFLAHPGRLQYDEYFATGCPDRDGGDRRGVPASGERSDGTQRHAVDAGRHQGDA